MDECVGGDARRRIDSRAGTEKRFAPRKIEIVVEACENVSRITRPSGESGDNVVRYPIRATFFCCCLQTAVPSRHDRVLQGGMIVTGPGQPIRSGQPRHGHHNPPGRPRTKPN